MFTKLFTTLICVMGIILRENRLIFFSLLFKQTYSIQMKVHKCIRYRHVFEMGLELPALAMNETQGANMMVRKITEETQLFSTFVEHKVSVTIALPTE